MVELGADSGLEGQQEARTRDAAGETAADRPRRSQLEQLLDQDVARLAGLIGADAGDQLDLLDGSPDVENLDPIQMAANLTAKRRRGPGRPSGSPNRKTAEVFELLAKLGHRDPLVTLSMIQTANTTALAAVLGAEPVKVLAIQAKAAADLAQYNHAKRVKAEIDSRHLHLFVAGQIGAGAAAPGERKGLSIFGGESEQNQGVIDAAPVRQDEAAPHDAGLSSQSNGLAPDRT